MAKLSQLTIPVKNPSTGAVTSQTFDLAGSGGGGSDTNFIGTKAEYDALPSSEKAKYDSMDFTDYHDGLSIDPTPMINSKNPVASGGVYAKDQVLSNSITDAVELVAPLESALVATRNYSVGDQFVYNGFLYKVTANIPFDSEIIIGTNCELAPCVVEQIRALATETNSQISNLSAAVNGLSSQAAKKNVSNTFSEHQYIEAAHWITANSYSDSQICVAVSYQQCLGGSRAAIGFHNAGFVAGQLYLDNDGNLKYMNNGGIIYSINMTRLN